MTIEQILHEAEVEKMNTDCIQGLTTEQTVERIARLKSYQTTLKSLRASTTDRILISIEISNAGAAIQWHTDVLDQMGTFPEYLKQFSQLGSRFGDRTFSTLDNRIDAKAKSTCIGYVNKYADNHWKDKNGLVLSGATGVGKTHLAAAISNELIPRKVAVFFVNVPEVYDRIRDEMGHKDYTKATMKSCDLLVLDDLGKEKRSEWTDQVLYEIVNSRYEKRKPIIVTTNYSAQELANNVDKAVVSRLFEMCVFVNVNGTDRRI